MCGNQQCEHSEACVTVGCVGGCPADCPSYAPPCPLAALLLGANITCAGVGVCVTATGQCDCFPGYTGPVCQDCSPGYVRLGSKGVCVFLPGALTSCTDGVRNGNEEGVDCGGPNCAPCAHGINSVILWAAVGSGACIAVLLLLFAGRTIANRKRKTSITPIQVKRKRSSVFSRKADSVQPTVSVVPDWEKERTLVPDWAKGRNLVSVAGRSTASVGGKSMMSMGGPATPKGPRISHT